MAEPTEPQNVPLMHLGAADDAMQRVRPSSVLPHVRRSQRRAEIVCAEGDGRPHVLAVVYPVGVPLDRCEVATDDGGVRFGSDLDADCRCGRRHHVNGARLRSALMALPTRSGRVPTVDVRTL